MVTSVLEPIRYHVEPVPLGTDTWNECELAVGLMPTECAYVVDTVTLLKSGPYSQIAATAIAAKWNRVYSAVVSQVTKDGK